VSDLTNKELRRRPNTPLNPPPCRWPECLKLSDFFALDNRAKFGYLCTTHWYGFINLNEQAFYEGAPQGAFGKKNNE
jgi:hypothetical protein